MLLVSEMSCLDLLDVSLLRSVALLVDVGVVVGRALLGPPSELPAADRKGSIRMILTEDGADNSKWFHISPSSLIVRARGWSSQNPKGNEMPVP